ncbi:glyoxalase/bleomycin resistance protein/dioxygenase superfamily protein [Flavobacteriaceae bacterium MAR_2009_75]|nr:glyoxalase/bleomycin resistance protein/dioxygenase superfamily protein [Flavobacteriaceae bacterium MAR_2009_75]
MKRTVNLVCLLCLTASIFGQVGEPLKKRVNMKLNAGVITEKLTESKKFYSEILDFGVTFENEFYLLMHTPNREAEIGFLLPDHPSQQPLFQERFSGKGMYLTIEVKNVDELYNKIKEKNVDIKIPIRDEPWGDRHFAIEDPNGIGIDIVTYSEPDE